MEGEEERGYGRLHTLRLLPAAASQSTCDEVLDGEEYEHWLLRNCGLFVSDDAVHGPVVLSPRLLISASTCHESRIEPLAVNMRSRAAAHLLR